MNEIEDCRDGELCRWAQQHERGCKVTRGAIRKIDGTRENFHTQNTSEQFLDNLQLNRTDNRMVTIDKQNNLANINLKYIGSTNVLAAAPGSHRSMKYHMLIIPWACVGTACHCNTVECRRHEARELISCSRCDPLSYQVEHSTMMNILPATNSTESNVKTFNVYQHICLYRATDDGWTRKEIGRGEKPA